MKICSNCTAYNHPECSIYKKEPPHSFAARCNHFIMIAEYVQPPEPIDPDCSECDHNIDGWCLQFDHSEYHYNFVKIKEDTQCPLI